MKPSKVIAFFIITLSALYSNTVSANPMCIFHDTVGAGRILRAINEEGIPGITKNSMDVSKDNIDVYSTIYKDFVSREASNQKCIRSAAYKVESPSIDVVVVSFSYQMRSGESKKTVLAISDGKLVKAGLALPIIQKFREDR